jgi:hypothetical protein
VVLGLCFLGIVFFIPDGILGLFQKWWRLRYAPQETREP